MKPPAEATSELESELARLRAEVDRLMAILRVMNARITELEASNAELRALQGLDIPPATIGEDWMTTKMAAHRSGYSKSMIRHFVATGKLKTDKRGGRVLIDPSSLPTRRTKKLTN